MYKHFFGLRENPFNVNPDPRYLFLTPQTSEALDDLTYGIQARKGLILLTGEVGTGKTTLLNRLLDWLHEQQTPAAFIFNSHLEIGHLFDFIMADFGLPFDARLKGNALMRLNQWLFERYRAGETPMIIVDEAQGLPDHVLEEIRMLLNLETPSEKLLQIVLAGQPELEERLERPELRQMKQRIALRCKTAALSLEQTHDYIRARLHIAGANGKPVFASEAMDAVYFYSRGIPRVMNLLCEHALINAYVDHVQPVPAPIVAEVAREFQFDDIKPAATAINSGDTLDCNWKAAQSVFKTGPVSMPAAAEPPWKEQLEPMASPSSASFVSGENMHSPVKEFAVAAWDREHVLDHEGNAGTVGPLGIQATVPVALEQTQTEENRPSELTEFFTDLRNQFGSRLEIKPTPDPLPRLLQVVEPKGRFVVLPSNHNRLPDAHKPSHSPPTLDASKSVYLRLSLNKIVAVRVFLVHRSARWRDRVLSTAIALARTQRTKTLRRRLKRSMEPLRAWYRRCVAGWGRGLTIADSMVWPRRKASISHWLRQPWDPTQWRMSDSRLFEARRGLSCKKM